MGGTLEAAAGLTIVFFLVGFFIVLVVGAIILRAGCWLFNKMAGGEGSPGSVPGPGFGKAILVVLVTLIVQVVAGIVLGAIGSLRADMGPAMINLISLPLSFLVSAGMISALLPTSFVKGLGVAVCEYIMMIVVFAIVFVIFGTIGAVMLAG